MDTLSWPVILGLVCLVYAALAVIAGLYVADVKNRSPAEGFWFPLLFGPIGVLIVACLPAGNYRESQAASDPDEMLNGSGLPVSIAQPASDSHRRLTKWLNSGKPVGCLARSMSRATHDRGLVFGEIPLPLVAQTDAPLTEPSCQMWFAIDQTKLCSEFARTSSGEADSEGTTRATP